MLIEYLLFMVVSFNSLSYLIVATTICCSRVFVDTTRKRSRWDAVLVAVEDSINNLKTGSGS